MSHDAYHRRGLPSPTRPGRLTHARFRCRAASRSGLTVRGRGRSPDVAEEVDDGGVGEAAACGCGQLPGGGGGVQCRADAAVGPVQEGQPGEGPFAFGDVLGDDGQALYVPVGVCQVQQRQGDHQLRAEVGGSAQRHQVPVDVVAVDSTWRASSVSAAPSRPGAIAARTRSRGVPWGGTVGKDRAGAV